MHERNIKRWIAAAMWAPMAHLCGCGWGTAVLLSLAILPLTSLPGDGWNRLGKNWCRAELLWLALLTGWLMKGAGAYWPTTQRRFVPLALLALAAVNAGRTKALRGALVLSRVMPVLLAAAAVGALTQLRWRWLWPALLPWSPGLVTVLLLPALSGIWGSDGVDIPPLAALAAAPAALCQGILSPAVAGAYAAPVYETARSMTAGGLCWELPVAVAMTLGWFVLGSYLLTAVLELGSRCAFPEKHGKFSGFAVAAAAMVLLPEPNPLISGGICLFLWVIVPFCKKMKKPEKRS